MMESMNGLFSILKFAEHHISAVEIAEGVLLFWMQRWI